MGRREKKLMGDASKGEYRGGMVYIPVSYTKVRILIIATLVYLLQRLSQRVTLRVKGLTWGTWLRILDDG